GGTGTLPNKALSGTGTINAPYDNSGSIAPSGANGLTFRGVINGAGQGIGGTLITFDNGGGFTGTGDIGARVNSLDGSTITATGRLSMGLGVGGAATPICGTLNTGTFAVSLIDAVRPLITGTVEIGGGGLAVPASGVQDKRIGGPVAAIRGSGGISNPLYNN